MSRIALVGYGRIAPKHLAVLRAQGAEVVAACNRSAEGRARAESEGGIARTYAAIGEMIERERPDGVLCCASSDTQYMAALEVIPHGLPTLLEKPPGLSLEEYTHLCAVAERHATPVMVAMNRRHYSVIHRAINDAGGMENVESVSVEWSEDPAHFLNRGFSVERVSREVFSNSLHGLDMLTWLAGPIDDAHVVGLDFGDPLRWMMSLQGVSQRGALATFHSTWDSPGRWRFSYCTPGRRYVFAPLETCEVHEAGTRETRALEPAEVDVQFKPGFHGQAAAFLQMVKTREVPLLHSLAAVGPAVRLADKLTSACLRAGKTQFAKCETDVTSRPKPKSAAIPVVPSHRKPLRIVALADSLAMARSEPAVIQWEETWPARLAAELISAGIDAEVINCGARARTADQLLDTEFEEHVVYKQPDVVVLQVGIVDCSPRIFSKRERSLLNRRFVPASLRNWIIQRRAKRRDEILRNSDPLRKVYTRPDEFTQCLEQFAAKASRLDRPPRLVVLPVLCSPAVMDRKSPGHTQNVRLYNDRLRSFALSAGADWIEPETAIPTNTVDESFVDDGYHLSVSGSARCAAVLAQLLSRDSHRASAPPSANMAGATST